jgi:pimeloyl-ACP methyl ester carboxylesterase
MPMVQSADGTRLNVRERGEGTPLVFVHGTSGGIGDWNLVARLLVPPLRVLTYDRRGRGGSTDGSAYDLDREVEDLHAVLDAAGEPCHLVGHSFGARVALDAMTTRSDLLSATLYEPPLSLTGLPPGYDAELAAATSARDWEAVLALFMPVAGMPPQEIAFFRSVPAVWSAFLDGARTVLRETVALRDNPFQPGALAGVDVPAQLLVGELTDAPLFLDGLDALANSLGAPVRRIAGQRHVAMAAAPQEVADLVRLLTGPGGPAARGPAG